MTSLNQAYGGINNNNNNNINDRRYYQKKLIESSESIDIDDNTYMIIMILSIIISLLFMHLKNKTLWKIYGGYDKVPNFKDSIMISLMVACWPLFYLKHYIL